MGQKSKTFSENDLYFDSSAKQSEDEGKNAKSKLEIGKKDMKKLETKV